MTGNPLTRAIFFWPAAALIRLGQWALAGSDTALGRLTLRPPLRLFCRFALYARPYMLRGTRTNDVVTSLGVDELIDGHRLLAVIPCACRAGRPPCRNRYHSEHALDVCLSFGAAAFVQIGSGLGRRVTVEEAKALCRKGAESGLVHHAIYSFGSLLELCNCCSETCSVVRAYKAGVSEAVRRSRWVAVRGPGCDRCRGGHSRVCEKLCPYGHHPSSAQCLGCSCCVERCPQKAILMVPREETRHV